MADSIPDDSEDLDAIAAQDAMVVHVASQLCAAQDLTWDDAYALALDLVLGSSGASRVESCTHASSSSPLYVPAPATSLAPPKTASAPEVEDLDELLAAYLQFEGERTSRPSPNARGAHLSSRVLLPMCILQRSTVSNNRDPPCHRRRRRRHRRSGARTRRTMALMPSLRGPGLCRPRRQRPSGRGSCRMQSKSPLTPTRQRRRRCCRWVASGDSCRHEGGSDIG